MTNSLGYPSPQQYDETLRALEELMEAMKQVQEEWYGQLVSWEDKYRPALNTIGVVHGIQHGFVGHIIEAVDNRLDLQDVEDTLSYITNHPKVKYQKRCVTQDIELALKSVRTNSLVFTIYCLEGTSFAHVNELSKINPDKVQVLFLKSLAQAML